MPASADVRSGKSACTRFNGGGRCGRDCIIPHRCLMSGSKAAPDCDGKHALLDNKNCMAAFKRECGFSWASLGDYRRSIGGH